MDFESGSTKSLNPDPQPFFEYNGTDYSGMRYHSDFSNHHTVLYSVTRLSLKHMESIKFMEHY
jgi:hypothetical protein